MKAVVCVRYGPPEVLEFKDLGKPVPREDEILVRIRATTVTVADVRVRGFRVPKSFWLPARLALGLFRPKCQVLGAELAGVVESVGGKVSLFKPGDEVFALGTGPGNALDFGCYAEYRCLPENSVVAHKPNNLSFEEAAAVPVGARTALHYLRKARLGPGKSVLVYGASGSVGSYAVQLAKHFGAGVHGVCGAANAELVLSLGAERVFDYAKAGFADELETYDAIFVAIDKFPFSECMKRLKPGGTYLNVTAPLKSLPMLVASLPGGKRKIFTGETIPREKEDLLFLKGLLEAGRIKPVIDKTFPFERIADAHRYVDQGHKRGNVAVTIP
jgi:NADPH:quinone reductase-like Zn-dependent oxidoreductase